MAGTTKTKTTKQPATGGAKARPERARKSSVEYVQQAMQDIDRARERAGVELRDSLDSALDRLRDVVGDLRTRAEHQASEFERAFDEATDEARREYGRQAIMAQDSPEALTEMTAAIRKRRAELAREHGGGNGKAQR